VVIRRGDEKPLQSQKAGTREGKTLDTLYTSILQQAFGDDDPEDDSKTRSVLSAVVLAVNPLSPSAIAKLLGFDIQNVSPLLSSVSSLLIFQEHPGHPVRPFHKSFPDFTTDSTRCTNKEIQLFSGISLVVIEEFNRCRSIDK